MTGDESFKAGDLVVFTSGEYEDYGLCTCARALRDFTLEEAVALPGNRWEIWQKTGHREPVIDSQTLVAAGLVERIESKELWLGCR